MNATNKMHYIISESYFAAYDFLMQNPLRNLTQPT